MTHLEITIHCPELSELAQALQGKRLEAVKVVPATVECAAGQTASAAFAAPAPTSTASTAAPADPVPATAAPAAAAPVAPVAPAAPVAPVAPQAPAYDLETLIAAAAKLMDNGKQSELCALLTQYNVQTMKQLPPEHYNAFGEALKEMGAKL